MLAYEVTIENLQGEEGLQHKLIVMANPKFASTTTSLGVAAHPNAPPQEFTNAKIFIKGFDEFPVEIRPGAIDLFDVLKHGLEEYSTKKHTEEGEELVEKRSEFVAFLSTILEGQKQFAITLQDGGTGKYCFRLAKGPKDTQETFRATLCPTAGSEPTESDDTTGNTGTPQVKEEGDAKTKPSAAAAAAARIPSLFFSQDVSGLAQYLKDHNIKKVAVMIGAGLSVAAGIPDFRSKDGLYSKVAESHPEFPNPEHLFTLDFFYSDPTSFYNICEEMNIWPDAHAPTLAHYFIKKLQDENMLHRCYTQNVDGLESLAGIEDEKTVEAHGSFSHCSCTNCNDLKPWQAVRNYFREEKKPLMCEHCKNVPYRPCVVFFGEALPQRFFQFLRKDSAEVDALLVIGTSLQVYPFASAVDHLGVERTPMAPRVLINRDRVGDFTCLEDFQDAKQVARDFALLQQQQDAEGEEENMPRLLKIFRSAALLKKLDDPEFVISDLFLPGDCQETCLQLSEGLWGEKGKNEVLEMYREGQEKLRAAKAPGGKSYL